MSGPPFQLVRRGQGALPILDAVIARIGLERHLTEALSITRYAHAVLLLVKNIVVERNALYVVAEWAAPYDPDLVYGGKFSDDVLARALDRLFETERASPLIGAILQAVKADGVDLSQIHQDTTSVKLTGAYQKQQRRAVQLVRGFSKDHRPDLRQLVPSTQSRRACLGNKAAQHGCRGRHPSVDLQVLTRLHQLESKKMISC
jgi:hypothetical protein